MLLGFEGKELKKLGAGRSLQARIMLLGFEGKASRKLGARRSSVQQINLSN